MLSIAHFTREGSSCKNVFKVSFFAESKPKFYCIIICSSLKLQTEVFTLVSKASTADAKKAASKANRRAKNT